MFSVLFFKKSTGGAFTFSRDEDKAWLICGWRNLPSAKTLSVMIFLAGIGLIVSVISLIYLSQHLISIKTNEIDRHRSVLSVDGAVQTSVNRVLSLVLDNSIWDDAVKQTYAPC